MKEALQLFEFFVNLHACPEESAGQSVFTVYAGEAEGSASSSVNSSRHILTILPALTDSDESSHATDWGRRFAELVDELYEPLCRYLFLICSDFETAREAAQEAFLRLHRELLNENWIDRVRPWLFRVGHNLVIDHARQTRDEASLTNESVARRVEQHYGQSTPNPEQLLLKRERLQKLDQALRSLPRQQRHCLFLRREGFRYREIASILAMGETTVIDHIKRAVSRLARDLNES